MIKRGPVELVGGSEGALSITQPSLLFMPRPDAHRLIADDRNGADVVCASIQFGAGGRNPITDSQALLTDFDHAPVDPRLKPVLEYARVLTLTPTNATQRHVDAVLWA